MGNLLSLSAPASPPGVSKATQTEWDCPGCRRVHSDTTLVPCGHQLCLGCLLRHSATSATCPQCDSPMLSARFSVLGQSDFLQCVLSPAGVPLGPSMGARRALFRLVYDQAQPPDPQAAPGPAEQPGQEPVSSQECQLEMWAELLQSQEHLLDSVRPWLRQSLHAIYGPQWWEARQVESIALSTLCICGPDQQALTHTLHGYLGEYTAQLIHGLLHVTMQSCRDAWQQRLAQVNPGGRQEQNTADGVGPGESSGHGLGQHQTGPDQLQYQSQSQSRAGSPENGSDPGPSTPRTGRTRRTRRWSRPREETRRSRRRRADRSRCPFKLRGRK